MSANVVLISTYELGRQPFGLASPAAWLKAAGANVTLQDLALCQLDLKSVREADLVGFYVPMHTATRLAEEVLARVRQVNESAHICFFGLYAPMNEKHLRTLGADTVLGGEFEKGLVDVYLSVVGEHPQPYAQTVPSISLSRQKFMVPDRTGLPELDQYARLQVSPEVSRIVGYTEASRGCKHLCRHCPVVPVYNGRFIIVQPKVVLEDVRRQVDAGAEHITFGDPDFFNGPQHSLRIVRRLHEEFPELSYDVTIKVEHLLEHSGLLPTLKETGCVLITSAVESFDDHILEKFDKHHTMEDFKAVLHALQEVDLALNPTFVTFTPWTTAIGYTQFLQTLALLNLVEHVSPVQYAIRLLIPAGSKLLELDEITDLVSDFDDKALLYPWKNPDPAMDLLYRQVLTIVEQNQAAKRSRRDIFSEIWTAVHARHGDPDSSGEPPLDDVRPMADIPYLTEPWYC
ncbi:MAG: radical SAM protein [Acidobacteria bacterium]|nr:radical SAM protein [Acidobacteriota bacterium]